MTADTSNLTPEEQRNIDTVVEYMRIAYSPGRASAQAVAPLCARGNRFIAPSTFPDVHSLEKYADEHGRIMEQLDDLHFVSFDVLFAKADRVCLRYTAEGSHRGRPHGTLPPTGRTARWTASALFRVEDGRIVEFIKDWNKLSMWEQLGWPLEECLTQHRDEAGVAPASRADGAASSLGGLADASPIDLL